MRLLSRFDIEGPDGSVYMTRWTLHLPGGWDLKLHRIRREDWTPALHDHPWRFWSLVLWGGYRETTWGGARWRLPWTLAYRPATFAHRVKEVRQPCWTLVLCGPKVREWGFWSSRYVVTDAGAPGRPWLLTMVAPGWTPWRAFLAANGYPETMT